MKKSNDDFINQARRIEVIILLTVATVMLLSKVLMYYVTFKNMPRDYRSSLAVEYCNDLFYIQDSWPHFNNIVYDYSETVCNVEIFCIADGTQSPQPVYKDSITFSGHVQRPDRDVIESFYIDGEYIIYGVSGIESKEFARIVFGRTEDKEKTVIKTEGYHLKSIRFVANHKKLYFVSSDPLDDTIYLYTMMNDQLTKLIDVNQLKPYWVHQIEEICVTEENIYILGDDTVYCCSFKNDVSLIFYKPSMTLHAIRMRSDGSIMVLWNDRNSGVTWLDSVGRTMNTTRFSSDYNGIAKVVPSVSQEKIYIITQSSQLVEISTDGSDKRQIIFDTVPVATSNAKFMGKNSLYVINPKMNKNYSCGYVIEEYGLNESGKILFQKGIARDDK